MTLPAQPVSVATRLERPNEGRRRFAQGSEQSFDRVQDTGNPSKGECGCTEPHHLSVGGIRVAADNVHGVRGRIDVVEVGVQPVQHRLQLTS